MSDHDRDELQEMRHAELVEHLKQIRIEQRDGLDGFRQQQSAEHGSLFAKLTYITEMLVWIKQKWAAFTRMPDRNNTWPGDKK
jgi:hypothetical protein